MKKYFIIASMVVLTGCSIVKTGGRKLLPVAEKEIPKLVEKYFAERLEDGDLTEKQQIFLKKETYKLLIWLDEKAKLYLSE